MSIVVTINDHSKHFCPSQNIVGKVHCSIKNRYRTEIKVRIVGEECSYYYYNPSRNQFSEGRCRTRNFLKTEYTSLQTECFEVGNYSFPFNVKIPKHACSSYVGKSGYIKFYIQAVMVLYGRERKEDRIEFKMFSPIDLNDMLNLSLTTSTHSKALAVKKWWCMRESVRMEVKLERNAFVLGEVIDVAVEMSNDSRLSVSAVKFELYVIVAIEVAPPKPHLSIDQLLASNRGPGVPPYKSVTYVFRLKIPDVVQLPNFQGSHIFSKKSVLEVTAELKNSSKPKLKLNVPLMLGHIPIAGWSTFPKDAPGNEISPLVHPPVYGLTDASGPSPPPPYSATPTSRLSMPDVHSYSISSNNRLVPLATDPFDTTKSIQEKGMSGTDVRPSAPPLYEMKSPSVAGIGFRHAFLSEASSLAPNAPPLDADHSDRSRFSSPTNSDSEESEENEYPSLIGRSSHVEAPPTYEEACSLLTKEEKDKTKTENVLV